MRRMMGSMIGWKVVAPVAALGLLTAVAIGGCGDDDESCGYLFTSVTTESDCDQLQDELDCGSSTFDADAETCQLGNCGICADIDTDFDGDFDFDGDIDDDGD
jgi:hypothetical protein